MPSTGGRMRVAVVDRDPLHSSALATTLGQRDDLEIVAIEHEPARLFAILNDLVPDIALVDVDFIAKGAGARFLRHPLVRNGRTTVVLMTALDRPDAAELALQPGPGQTAARASGRRQLVEAVRSAHRARLRAGPEAWTTGQGSGPVLPAPTKREMELLRALVVGARNAEIAEQLELSVRTVESHLRRLFSRYQVVNRSELMMVAISQGWVSVARRE